MRRLFQFLHKFDYNGYTRACPCAASNISTVLVICTLMVYKLMLKDTGYVPYSVPSWLNWYETLILLEVLFYKHNSTLPYTLQTVLIHAHKRPIIFIHGHRTVSHHASKGGAHRCISIGCRDVIRSRLIGVFTMNTKFYLRTPHWPMRDRSENYNHHIGKKKWKDYLTRHSGYRPPRDVGDLQWLERRYNLVVFGCLVAYTVSYEHHLTHKGYEHWGWALSAITFMAYWLSAYNNNTCRSASKGLSSTIATQELYWRGDYFYIFFGDTWQP